MIANTLKLGAFVGLLSAAAADVVILPGAEPKPFKAPSGRLAVNDFFRLSLNTTAFDNPDTHVIRSPFEPDDRTGEVFLNETYPDSRPSTNSFIHGALAASGENLHLVLRPEEVWFQILSQTNFYNNGIKREVYRGGQGDLTINEAGWVQDLQLPPSTALPSDWTKPEFTTTTGVDRTAAQMFRIAITREYSSYGGPVGCGLPSVTLQGDKSDWEEILHKLERLSEFGDEPKAWADELRPVILNFVRSFGTTDSDEIRSFWKHMAVDSVHCALPEPPASGWILKFVNWDVEGKRIDRPDLNRLPVAHAGTDIRMMGQGRSPVYAHLVGGSLGLDMKQGTPSGLESALDRAGMKSSGWIAEGEQGTLKPFSTWAIYEPIETKEEWND